ncbi:hypothetical protein EGP64_00005, partial [bacterium]|nr:hypothetical protein [bacterium]
MNTLTKIRKKIVLDKYDLILFFLTFLSFLAVLYILYPGILTYDSYTQLLHIYYHQWSASWLHLWS